MCNITDEDLNTKSNLITEKYNFELTGLKDPVDVRKPSRNFLKIENLFSKIFSRKIKTGPGLQGEGNLENDLTLSIKS
ncbi:MAG: hypothetical protein ACRC1R_05215, partial [Cetobacterium sp.]|uniref:hypothetical protein n=1 Tax=Cetobacterium sp. TaxID=2071632 RepID=UPI003F3177B8